MKQDPTYGDVRALVLSELDTALSAIDPQSVEQLMEAVLSSRKVFFVGVGRVLLSLEAMAKRWAHLGIDTHIVGEINAATDVPLVLHGGSGIPNDQLAIAFQEGINKFNVGTEYFWLYFQTLKKFTADPDANFFQLPEVVQDALMNYLRQKMLLCTMTV